MALVALAAVKRRLRQSPITGRAYHGLARCIYFARMIHAKYRFGRYFPMQYFDRIFASNPDPWSYQTCFVSQERKALMLDRIPRRHFRRLLEIGCAAGWMTTELATRADAVLAVDISPIAIRVAATHCAQLGNIRFQNVDILTSMPDGIFDAIVCAGVLVYLPWSAQEDVCARIVKSLEQNGILLLEHKLSVDPGEVAARRVHALYAAHPELVLLERVEKDIYEVLLFRRIASQNGRAKR
jgi:2-polyprenyl-3-methyl-5-hydroxy-6-metoxy-1,4-benzoquinol methylase